jgi:hypothetical protein
MRQEDNNEPITEEEVGDLVKNLHEQGMTELDTFIQDEEDGTNYTATRQHPLTS